MISIGICDDDIIYLENLFQRVHNITSDLSQIKLHKLLPKELELCIQNKNLAYDILILDIDMGDLNGIELVQEINQLHPSCIIIFISNHLHYATRVYDVEHVYFVWKLEEETRLPKAIDKALSVLKSKENTCLEIQYKNVNYIIPLVEISHIEVFGRYLYIYHNAQTYKCIRTLKSISHSLSSLFVRCHKSIIVNLEFVYSVSRSNCILKNKVNIPISNTYSKSFSSAFRQYASSKTKENSLE